MGSNCGVPHPEPSGNFCFAQSEYQAKYNVDYSKLELPNFCSYAGPAGDSYVRKYCENIDLNQGEWTYSDSRGSTCNYEDTKPYIDYGFGCCDGSCGIVGEKALCERTGKFNGDPITCCFNDFICQANNLGYQSPSAQDPSYVGCFTDLNMTKTCEYVNWNITSQNCQENVGSFCSGQDIPIGNNSWMDRWGDINNSCLTAMIKNSYDINSQGGCGLSVDSDVTNSPINFSGLTWSKEMMQAVFKRYKEDGFILGSLPNQKGYSPFQNVLFNVCENYPQFCDYGLTSYCSDFTIEQVSKNITLANWCGCYLNNSEYENYSENYNIGFECTPICNTSQSVKKTGINGEPIICTKNVCILDDITVNVVNSQILGSVDFSQICGKCDNCTCFISNNNIDINNSTILGNVYIANQNCGDQYCSIPNKSIFGPRTLTVPCDNQNNDTYDDYDQTVENEQNNANYYSKLFTYLIIGLIIFILTLLSIFLK